jgi:hypothetical protein
VAAAPAAGSPAAALPMAAEEARPGGNQLVLHHTGVAEEAHRRAQGVVGHHRVLEEEEEGAHPRGLAAAGVA